MEQWTSQSAIAAEDGGRNFYCQVRSASKAKSSSLVVSFRMTISIFVAVLFLSPSSSFAWQRLAATSKPVLNLSPRINEGAPASVVELIDRLDSPAFARRQSATVSIIDYGATALPDLCQRFFESSPETNYRIRKALEGIAAAGDEGTFLKSSAILLTLYSNGNDHIYEQIEELKVQWQAQRTEFAIAALKRTGAEVVQQKGYDARLGQRGVTVRTLGGVPVSRSEKVKFVKRTVSEQKMMVDRILRSDFDTNRDFIFELMPSQALSRPSLAPNGSNLNLPLLAGTRIKFPAGWAEKNTDTRALKELRHIDDRLFVECSNTNFSKAQWQLLVAADNIVALDLAAKEQSAQVPLTFPASLQALTLTGFEIVDLFAQAVQNNTQLQQVEFNNCSFDKRSAAKIDSVESIKNIVCQFENQKLGSEAVLAMAEFGDLRTIHLTAIEFSDAALQDLRRLENVGLLYVSDMPATSQFFQNVGAMPRLNSIQFKGCKLNIPAYKKLADAQRVRMSFEAQAFLGIQGSSPINGRGLVSDAVVSMVVPDSAAEEGGIKAGDLISKIDGEEVEDFNDIRLHITQYSAGDEVEIEVMRDGKREALKVKLRDYQTARKF